MTLFPQINNDYISYQKDNDLAVKEMMAKYYADSITINQSFWSEADIDSRFLAGDQQLTHDIYGNLPAFRRRVFNFNRILRIKNMVGGYQRNHRKSTRVIPVENSDEKTAQQFTKLMLWAMEMDGTLDTFSTSFDGMLTTGMDLLSVWMDYREDPINGRIKVDNVSYNGFLIDPFFRKHDLSDCNFIWRRKWLTKVEMKSLLPDRKSDIDKLYASSYRDGKFQFLPEAYNYGMQDLLTYDEFWYRAYRKQKLLVDTKTGETMEWKGQDEDLDLFRNQFSEITVIDVEIPTTRLAIVAQDVVMYDGPNPLGIDRYPYAIMLGYYYPQIPYFPYRIQGIVRSLRDAQFLYNRRKVIELDILESQVNSGWKYKPDSLVNPKDIYLQGQGRGVAIKDTANMADVEQIQTPSVPSSMMELSKLMGEEMQQISGVNEELIGSATDDKAGILSMLRQGAGLTTLQILFDQADYTQKNLGRIFMDLMQANFSPGHVKRIIGEEPTQQFYSKAFGKYDAAVVEGINSTTQRQMQFSEMMEMRTAGIEGITDEDLLEASSLMEKEKYIERNKEKQEKDSQIAELKLQLEIARAKAEINDLESRAHANTGLGLERAARVQENRALAIERLAEAQKDRDLGALDKVKAVKEVEGMELSNVLQGLEVVRSIEEQTSAQQEEDKAAVQAPNVEELAILAQGEQK